MYSMVESLPRMHKVLSSTAYTAKRRNKSKEIEHCLFQDPPPQSSLPVSFHRQPLHFFSHVGLTGTASGLYEITQWSAL